MTKTPSLIRRGGLTERTYHCKDKLHILSNISVLSNRLMGWRQRKREPLVKVIKVSICQEDITIISVHTSNNKNSKYMKQKLAELKKDKLTILAGDFITRLSKTVE